MGCFSFICHGCNKPINSSSFRGERCDLFLLKAGRVMEHMNGEYDSYGRVFDKNGESIPWSMPWSVICELMNNDKIDDGIAAYHEDCYDDLKPRFPKESSPYDPNQGWGFFTPPETLFIK